MVGEFTIVTGVVENFEKLAWIARISRDSYQGWANWVNFVQFAVILRSAIFLCAKWKMVGKFSRNLPKVEAFGLLWGGVHESLYRVSANGVDFASFII